MGYVKKYQSVDYTWKESPLMRWNGSSWVRASVYRWDGTAWVKIQGAVATSTYNATGYYTRDDAPGVKHYLKTLISSSACVPKYIGYYEEVTQFGYLMFDFSAIRTALAGNIAQSARLNVKYSSNTSDTLQLYTSLVYSDSSASDAYSNNIGNTIVNSFNGDWLLINDSQYLAELAIEPRIGTRYPYAFMIGPYNEDPLTSATGVTISNAQLVVTYET